METGHGIHWRCHSSHQRPHAPLLQSTYRSLSLSLHGSHLTLCDLEPHHLRQQLWCQHLGDWDSPDSCSLCKVCTSSFSGYKVSAGCVSAKPMTASARGYRKKGVEIRCWQGNVSHIDIMKQVCQGMSRLDLAGGLDFQRAMCCGIGIEPASESSKPKLASKVDIVQLNSRLISLDWDAVSTSLGCCRK